MWNSWTLSSRSNWGTERWSVLTASLWWEHLLHKASRSNLCFSWHAQHLTVSVLCKTFHKSHAECSSCPLITSFLSSDQFTELTNLCSCDLGVCIQTVQNTFLISLCSRTKHSIWKTEARSSLRTLSSIVTAPSVTVALVKIFRSHYINLKVCKWKYLGTHKNDV